MLAWQPGRRSLPVGFLPGPGSKAGLQRKASGEIGLDPLSFSLSQVTGKERPVGQAQMRTPETQGGCWTDPSSQMEAQLQGTRLTCVSLSSEGSRRAS